MQLITGSGKFFNVLVWIIILSLTFAVLYYNINDNPDNPAGFDIKKEIIGWLDENRQKPELNPETYDIEDLVFRSVNDERRKNGLRALTWDSRLAEAARFHSIDMANRSYFSHENPEGEDPTMRAKKRGVETEIQRGSLTMIGIAENIGMMPKGFKGGYGYVGSSNDITNAMMKSWMNSPAHRANILDDNFDFIGVGVSHNGYGTYYLIQDFR